jgi:hypothetical protein
MRMNQQKTECFVPAGRGGICSRTTRIGRSSIARRWRVVVLVSLLLPTFGFAQKPTDHLAAPTESSIQGDVILASSDGRRNILPGVTLSLTAISPETSSLTTRSDMQDHLRLVQDQKSPAGGTLTALTDAQGHYAFSQLKPGSYGLQAAPKGFQPFSEVIVLSPGELHVANVELRLASTVQTVKVRDQATAAAPGLQGFVRAVRGVSAGAAKQFLVARGVSRTAALFREKLTRTGLTSPAHFFGLSETGFLEEASMGAILRRLPDGQSELMCHPGNRGQDLWQAGTRLVDQRQTELRALTSARVKGIVALEGIQLVTYELAELQTGSCPGFRELTSMILAPHSKRTAARSSTISGFTAITTDSYPRWQAGRERG